MDYVVELVSDKKTNAQADICHDGFYPLSFVHAKSQLTNFIKKNGGQVKGWFNYEGKRNVGSAVVNMSPKTANLLEDFNINLLQAQSSAPDSQPFVSRIQGNSFNISPRHGIKMFPVSELII